MSANDNAFFITRVFKAPKARIWQAWSEAASLQKWWGPQGCTVEALRFEFQPGGFFHYAMKFDGAPTWWGRFNYREIVAGERIVWLNSFANAQCGIARAPFSDVCPMEIENTATFTEKDGVTTVSLRALPFGEVAAERQYFEALKPSLEQGYGGTLDQLGAYLKA